MTSFEFVGVNLWFYSPSMLVGLRHSLARKSILGSGLKSFPSRVFASGGIGIQMLEGRNICRAVGLPASTCLAVPPHGRDGNAWERGRPARILSLIPWERGRPARMLFLITWERGRPARMLFLMVVAELPRGFAGSHYVGSNHNGPTEGEPWFRSRSIQVGRWPWLCQAWCGRDARAPRKPSSHDIVTPRAQNCRSILVPLVVEGGPSVFRSIRVYSCPLVVHLH